jgi:hypothetical protein
MASPISKQAGVIGRARMGLAYPGAHLVRRNPEFGLAPTFARSSWRSQHVCCNHETAMNLRKTLKADPELLLWVFRHY